MKLVFIVQGIRFVHIGANRNRMFQIQNGIFGMIGPNKIRHCFFILKHIAFLLLVAGKKAVKCHDHRQPDCLRYPEGTQIHVIDSLW